MIIEDLSAQPIAVVYLAISLLMLAFIEIGYQLGERLKTRNEKDTIASMGPMVGGLLAMLAFVLAFTFSLAFNQYEARKKVVVDEANAIGTAYLRADLITEPFSKEVKRLFQDYVDIRLQAAQGIDLKGAIAESVVIHKQLWEQVSSAALMQPGPNTSLAVQSINNVIDIHELRVSAGIRNRIPGIVWVTLGVISALAMITIGLQIGLVSKRRFLAGLPMSLAFAVVVALVVDLDRPDKGMLSVGQEAMINLKESMTIDVSQDP